MPRQNCNGICATVGWPVESFGVSIRLGAYFVHSSGLRRPSPNVVPRAPMDPSSGLRGVDGIPSFRIRSALRLDGAADFRELPHRVGCGSLCALLSKYVPPHYPHLVLAVRDLHACGLRLCAVSVWRENPAVSGGLAAADDHARNPHGRKLSDHEQSWPRRYGAGHRASVHGLRFRHLSCFDKRS